MIEPQTMAKIIQPRAAPVRTRVPHDGVSSTVGPEGTERSQGDGGGMAPRPAGGGIDGGGMGGGHSGGAGAAGAPAGSEGPASSGADGGCSGSCPAAAVSSLAIDPVGADGYENGCAGARGCGG